MKIALPLRLDAYRQLHSAIWILTGGRLATTTIQFMALPFLMLYLSARGIPLPLIGAVVALGPIGSSLGNLLGGHLADRSGRKPMIVLGLALGGAATVALALVQQAWAFAGIYTLQGLFSGLAVPAWSAAMTDLAPPEQRSNAFSLDRVATNIGTALGPLLGALAHQRASLFAAAGLADIAFGAVCLVFIAESRPTNAMASAGRGDRRLSAGAGRGLAEWREVLTDRPMVLQMLARVVSIAAYTQIFSTYSLYVSRFSPHPAQTFSWVIT